MKCEIIFIDLDKTLLDNDHRLSVQNRKALTLLGERGIVRVIATGRSLYSFSRLGDRDLPLDYLIYSTGLGIVKYPSGNSLMERHLSADSAREAAEMLISAGISFMVHAPVPENHTFLYWDSGAEVTDFKRRLGIYSGQARRMKSPDEIGISSQLLAIMTQNESEKFNSVQAVLSDFKVIRTTSPLDHRSIWMEILPPGVSKGHAADWLCSNLGIDRNFTASIGNDYNDLDLLLWTRYSFVVENAPEELKSRFRVVASNDQAGFASILRFLD